MIELIKTLDATVKIDWVTISDYNVKIEFQYNDYDGELSFVLDESQFAQFMFSRELSNYFDSNNYTYSASIESNNIYFHLEK